MFRDLQHAMRMLLQTKGWTAVLLLSLALGIGVNTTLFSAINSLLLKTLSVPEPEGLVRLRWAGPNQMRNSTSDYGYTEQKAAGPRVQPTFSFAVYEQLQASNQTLTGLLACAPAGRVNVVVKGQAELASAFLVSGTYFEVLGVPASIGRTIMPSDDRADAPPVAMISYGYWGRRFGKDPGVVGLDVTVNSTPLTIIGVTPAQYAGIQRLGGSAPDIHLPLWLDSQINDRTRLSQPTNWWLQIVGRLRPGVTARQVEGNLEGVFQATARAGWDSYVSELSAQQQAMSRNQNRTAIPSLDVASASRGVYDPSPNSVRSISILGVVVALILLIVCANVANLLLSRATARQKEIAVRLSIGASRARLIRQLLTESLLLSAIGGGLAVLVAYWSRQLLPMGQDAPLDWRVFVFVAGISLVTGLAFGIMPALHATRVDLAGHLKETSRNLSRSRSILSKALLVVQVAISLVLLIGAGLFLRTLHNLRNVDVGFNTQNLLLVSVDPQVNRYDQERSKLLLDEMREAFQAIAGVQSVSLSQTALLAGSTWVSTIHIQGGESEEGNLSVHMMTVSAEFFETLGIPLLLGRGLTRRDGQGAPRVALINGTAAREYFSGGNPLGRRFGFSPEDRGEIEVVGVIGDTKYSRIRDAPPPTVYQSYLQNRIGRMTFELRTAVEPGSVIPSVREAARRVDPNLPLADISTQAEEVEGRFSQERAFALAYSLFGGLALLLACIGLFGLMSYNVARRTNEMGIRLALGAQRWNVVRMVLRESLLLVLIGLLIGISAALAAGRLIASQLYDLAPTDPLSMALAAMLMVFVAGMAGYLPARRASRVDPIIALHYE
ncbi:MAG: ABC transporter permease [Acidobacteriota bacterium]